MEEQNRRSEVSTKVRCLMGVLKGISTIWDVVTLPIYVVLQFPSMYRQREGKVYSRRLDVNDVSSPIVRDVPPTIDVLQGVETMEQLTSQAIKMFPSNPCLGTRQTLRAETQITKEGKILKKFVRGEYNFITYSELDRKIDLVGRGLMSLGVRPRQNVVILADTRAEWMITAQALLRINVPVVTLYATLGEEGIIHGINESEATHLVTTEELLPKIHKVLPKLSAITTVIYMEDPLPGDTPKPLDGINLLSFTELLQRGETADPWLVGEIPKPDDTAILMYTSGSTGIPKGVMISHKNIVATAKGFAPVIGSQVPGGNLDDVYIAYLPLAHVLELAAESLALAMGTRIGYSSPFTLIDTSTAIATGTKGDAAVLRPTMMASVPLVLDRIKKGVSVKAKAAGAFSEAVFRHSLEYKQRWRNWGLSTPIVDKIVFRKVTTVLGGRLRIMASGSAPLSVDTHSFVETVLNCKLVQGYGLTETAAGSTIMEINDRSYGRVGAPLVGTSLKLIDWEEANYHVTDSPNPRGEILVGGDTVSKGYYKNEQLTNESFQIIDGTRWFFTGDIGELFPDGTVKIIDRKKDLVKLQFGEYVSLGKIETELKTCPLIDNCCVYGNSLETFLVAIVVPAPPQLANLAATIPGKAGKSHGELCDDPDVVKAVTSEVIAHARKCNLHKMEIPSSVKLCAEEWMPESGLVTAALKIRRKQIQDFYQSDIDRMYQEKKRATKST